MFEWAREHGVALKALPIADWRELLRSVTEDDAVSVAPADLSTLQRLAAGLRILSTGSSHPHFQSTAFNVALDEVGIRAKAASEAERADHKERGTCYRCPAVDAALTAKYFKALG